MTRKGQWIQVSSGIQFWPLDPRPEEILLEDIAHALSNMCRFGGHVPAGFYSVAQHSVLMTNNVAPEFKVAALLHDATEAYLVDVPRPIKPVLTNYHEIEENLARVIGKRFGVSLVPLPPEVVEADERMLMTEKRDLLKPAPVPWSSKYEPYEHFKVEPWSCSAAKYLFLERARELGIK
jgi:hypothetical protein